MVVDQEVSEVPRPPASARLAAAVEGLHTRGRVIAVAVIAATGFCLVVNASWTPSPDAALYLALGESLARGEGYSFNGTPHTFVPPGYPALVGAVAGVFGPGFVAYRVLMALVGMLTAVLGYALAVRLCGRDGGLLVGGLFAVNHVLLENSALTLADVPFAFAVLVALHALLTAARSRRRVFWTVMAGVISGASALVRVNGLGVAPAGAFFLWCTWRNVSKGRRTAMLGVYLVAAYAPALAWEWWKASFPVSFSEAGYLHMVAGRALEYQLRLMGTALWGYVGETGYAMTGLALKTGALEFIVPLIALWGAVAAWRGGERLLVPLTLVQYAGLLMSPAGSRYLIMLLPALYLFFGLGVLDVLGRTSWAERSGRLLVGCCAVLALLNAGHNAKTVYYARTALQANGAESERGLPFFSAARLLAAEAPDTVVLATHPRIIHYLSGRRTIPLVRSGVPDHQAFVQDGELIEALISRNNPGFLFVDRKNAAQFVATLEAVRRLGLHMEEIPISDPFHRFGLFRIGLQRSPG